MADTTVLETAPTSVTVMCSTLSYVST